MGGWEGGVGVGVGVGGGAGCTDLYTVPPEIVCIKMDIGVSHFANDV